MKLVRKRLDDAGVREHFTELARDARGVELRIKAGSVSYSESETADLADVSRRLLAGDILAVQVWYVLGDDWWCDTVMRRGDSYRLVRMKQDDPNAQ